MTTPENALVQIASPLPFEATLDRVSAAITSAKLTIFARIDHAANAREVGLTMPPATVLIYGAAKGGTPVMLAAPLAALDLPLRVLVRRTESGAEVVFHRIAPVLAAAGVGEDLSHRLDPAQALIVEALRQ